MKKITNTTQEAMDNPMLGLIQSLNIPAQERMGTREMVASDQLPSMLGSHGKEGSAQEQYLKMGIQVKGLTHGDKLFMDVVLPKGWTKKIIGGNESVLLDDKGRQRASIYYKAASYDRFAYVQFMRRYNYNVVRFLPTEEQGTYKEKTFRVKAELPSYYDVHGIMEGQYFDERRGFMVDEKQFYTTKKERVWVPSFKNEYEEKNNTPHYYEITDGGQVIFTTKNDPSFFTRRYKKNQHYKWWAEYERMTDRMDRMARVYLAEHYPKHEDINAYWD